MTEKKRARICATCTLSTVIKDSVSVKDSVSKKAIVKTLTVTVHDTIRYATKNPCADLCDSLGRLKSTFSREIKSDKGTKLNLYVRGNELVFKDIIDSLKQVIQVKDTAITHYKNTDRFHTEIKQEPARCEKEHVTKWKAFLIVSAQILWPLVLLFLGWKGFKYYRKYHLPFP